MKYQENFVGSKTDFSDYLKKLIPQLFNSRFAVEGAAVSIPADRELSYKVKYAEDEDGASFSLKVGWDNEIEMDLDSETEDED